MALTQIPPSAELLLCWERYKSFAKSFIENFSIPEFTQEQLAYVKFESDYKKLNEFLSEIYWNNKVSYKIEKQIELFLRDKQSKYFLKKRGKENTFIKQGCKIKNGKGNS